MITSICLVLLLGLVAFRGKRGIRPSWVATLMGLLSLATWGFDGTSSATLDAWLGSTNLITLARDILAVFAFWFYRAAVARATEREVTADWRMRGRLLRLFPWSLICLVVTISWPFMLISERGTTSPRFIIDRLDQPAMWLFTTIYMLTIALLSVDTARMLWSRQARLLRVMLVGYLCVIFGCAVEMAYLTAVHFRWGDANFREHAYFAAELPFFGGIVIITCCVAWTAVSVWSRHRLALLRLTFVSRRLTPPMEHRPSITRVIVSGQPRADAFRLLIAIKDSALLGSSLRNEDAASVERIALRFDSAGTDQIGDTRSSEQVAK
ncbi:hypothetical protein [Plantibacter sp. CFBP 8804]|uniref:hypothetical protein n=1 Tax=Plantibacter sp. CFBP 8804 TaxID=2775270 RepID=UPI00177D3195|nr:hypothetical protein [Plantibacter sp. CFBP 8804]MBD8518864.1 hypothetical protein [Plantibacter sp. CFBP 8804]